MKPKLGFPTQGEILKLLFDAFGILPRKEAYADPFDEKKKKTLQRQLQRLVSEEGNFNDNYEHAFTIFRQLLSHYLPAPQHLKVLEIVFAEMKLIYAEMIRQEGTHLSRSDSIQYFISVKAIPAFVLAVNQHMLLWLPDEGNGLEIDDLYWYLPSRGENGKIVMPLSKVINWTYKVCDLSQMQFHMPNTLGAKLKPIHEQNLENAINWVNGQSLPSFLALLNNFKESFDAQRCCGREIEKEIQEDILVCLVYARVATYLARQVRESFGDECLDDICAQMQLLTSLLADEVQEYKKEISPYLARQDSSDDVRRIWDRSCLHHDEFVRDKIRQVAIKLTEISAARPGKIPFRQDVLNALESKYGRLAVHLNLDRYVRCKAFQPSAEFWDLLNLGFELKKVSTTSIEHIREFELLLNHANQQEAMNWLLQWLYGAYHYRRGEYEEAYPYYEAAFANAKYRAGKFQYDLVNQYAEVAAKNDNLEAFKKVVEWARYIGLKIRWLRDLEPNKENLDFARSMLKRAIYTSL